MLSFCAAIVTRFIRKVAEKKAKRKGKKLLTGRSSVIFAAKKKNKASESAIKKFIETKKPNKTEDYKKLDMFMKSII